MAVHYTHSRSAILCFGGWGLQTLLHVAPRIQAAQEQRAARGKEEPDLTRITSLGAVLPEPLLTGSGLAQFRLSKLPAEQVLPPFYIERLLANIDHTSPTPGDSMKGAVLTESERRALSLMFETETILEPLSFDKQPFRAPAVGASLPFNTPDAETGKSLRRARRDDMFRAGALHADTVSRLIESNLLDPIRRDYLSPDDPFVQTTLYVVAPMFEPNASALIWPIVAGLMHRLGRRHISTVVGLFATGSYALDRSRPVEDAAGYAALAELEALTGVYGHASGAAQMRDEMLANIRNGSRVLVDHIGEPIFDHIYLLDREKSNQGVAEDSHELAVLAGNALEAFIAGSADLFVQEQLGYGLRAADQRPYSLVGAAADYVPVQQILHAVNRQEESRLVHEWVLRSSPDAPVPNHPLAKMMRVDPASPSLRDLGFSQHTALTKLAARMPQLFGNPSPSTVTDLTVRRTFVFSPVTASELRYLAPFAWADALDDQLIEVKRTFDLAAGPNAIDEALGLSTAGADTSLAFAAGLEADGRVVPQLLASMHRRTLDLLAASPAGLVRAHEQVGRWLHEVEESLQKLELELTPSMRELGRIQREQALNEWRLNYHETVAKTASLGSIMVRAGAAIALVALFTLIFVALSRIGWSPARDGLALAGFAVGIFAAGLLTYRIHRTRIRNQRLARIELARAELTAELQAQTHDGLIRMHQRLIQILGNWHRMLRDAMDELRDLSTPPLMPVVPPSGIHRTYLYVPYFNQQLWDRCLDYLRTRLDAYGQRSEERLDSLWGDPAWRQEMERILRSAPVSGATSHANQAHTIADFIRQTVRQSVAPVSIQEPNPVRSDLIRALTEEFSIERLLWRGATDEKDIQRQLRVMGIIDEWEADDAQQWTDRRYVEAAWNRAKPTANYDVADRLAVYGITVDFAAASGSADSDLTRSLLEEFGVRLLPTENPFTIIFVRTVHGLALDDLDSIRRYREELEFLPSEQRTLVSIVDNLRFYMAADRPYRDSVDAERSKGTQSTHERHSDVGFDHRIAAPQTPEAD